MYVSPYLLDDLRLFVSPLLLKYNSWGEHTGDQDKIKRNLICSNLAGVCKCKLKFQCVPEINALLTEMNWYWVNLERWRREFYLIRKRRPRPTVSQAGTVVGLIRHSQAKYSQNG